MRKITIMERKMKKSTFLTILLSLITCLCLALSVVACTNPDDTSSGSDDGPNNPPPSNFTYADKTVTASKLVTYDGPGVMTTSDEVSVKVENEDLFVYDTRVNHNRSFSYMPELDYNQVVIFDFEGTVTVTVTVNNAQNLTDAVVRPLEYNIKPTVSGNKITFKLEYTGNYVVEYKTSTSDKASDNALHIFANPIEAESEKIDPDNLPENTVYIGPGVWMANAIPVSENDTTVYLAGGAVVYGQIRTANLSGLTIKGRGVLAGELYSRTKANEFTLPIELQNCKNVTIENISILDHAGWAVTLYNCENVTINNLKIITARANGDGISVQACKNVKVNGGFVRTWDDSLVVKNVDGLSTNDVTFDGTLVWTDLAQSMEVGYETYGPKMENITFKNITVLHNFHKAAMSIHNADNAQISNVTYENVTIEDAQMLGDNQNDGENDFLIDITIAFNTEWTESGALRGAIKNVNFKNIKVLEMAQTIKCRMFGEGASSNVDGVTISNLTVRGKEVKALDDIGLTPGVYTSNVKLNKGSATGAIIALPYKSELASSEVSAVKVENIMQNGLVVPEFAVLNNQPTYAGIKTESSDITVTATYGRGDRANSPWNEGAVAVGTNPYTNLNDGSRATKWTFNQWKNVENEFIAVNFDFSKAMSIGNIRILGVEGSDVMRYYTVSIFSKNEENGDWKRIRNAADITLSPQASNYQDVLINSSRKYYGLQLRFFKKDDLTHPSTIEIGEIEFYPPSLTTNKIITLDGQHEDVYDINNAVDGNTLTYFESKKGIFPATFTIDMASTNDPSPVKSVKYINVHLPPLLLWENRTQEIEILGSIDGTNYEVIVARKEYLFDSSEGNMVAIVLDTPVQIRYIRFTFYSNSTGYGAQMSELYVFGE